MLSIIGLDDAALEGICEKARAKTGGGDTVCRLANYLFPTGRVVSGHKDALAVVRWVALSRHVWHRQTLLQAHCMFISGARFEALLPLKSADSWQKLSWQECRGQAQRNHWQW